MEQYVNIGSVAIYKDDGAGGYEYSLLLKPEDYVSEDASINLKDGMSFGAALEFQDDRVLVGCPYEEPADPNTGYNIWENLGSGVVYVFDKTDGTLIQRIIPDNTPAEWTSGSLSGKIRKEQNFGFSIAASDDFIVIGAPGYVDNLGSTEYEYSGRAYVYAWNSGTNQYDLKFTVAPTSKIANNRFGDSVAIDGQSIVIANSPKAGTSNPGAVRYITLTPALTGSTKDINITNTHASWEYSMAIDDGRIAVGSPSVDTIRVFKIIDGVSRLTHTITEDRLKSFEFGYTLEFSGDKLIIGCPNGYYKLGVVLRMGQVSGKYTLV
jgi:hypothetical protein